MLRAIQRSPLTERRPHRRRGRRGGRRNRPGGRGGAAGGRIVRRSAREERPRWDGSTSRPRSTTRTVTRTSGTRYEKIGADAIARYRRMRGDDVLFSSGWTSTARRSRRRRPRDGVSPQEFVDGIAARFQAHVERLAISYDQFIRTTEPGAQARRARADRAHPRRSPDDFYEKTYEGWYCVGCELFKRDDEIVDGKCVLHPTRTLEWTTSATGSSG